MILSTMVIGITTAEEDFEESGQGGSMESNASSNETIVIHTITASTAIQSDDYTENIFVETNETTTGNVRDTTLLNNFTYTTAFLYEDDENETTSTEAEEQVRPIETTVGYKPNKVTDYNFAADPQNVTDSQSTTVHEVTLPDSRISSLSTSTIATTIQSQTTQALAAKNKSNISSPSTSTIATTIQSPTSHVPAAKNESNSPFQKQSISTTPTPVLYNSTLATMDQRAKQTPFSVNKVIKSNSATRDSLAPQTTLLASSSSTTLLWFNNLTTRNLDGVSPHNSDDIIPIVGAVCAVLGILIGIIISAGIWYHLNKAKIRERRISKHSAIEKNPEEKTFERLDFNLTLPTNGGCENSVIDFPDDKHNRGSYESFESGLYHGDLIQIHVNSMYSEPETDEFQLADNQDTENDYTLTPDDYAIELSNQKTLPFNYQRSANAAPIPSRLVSYSALMQQDSSDQSTVSSSRRYGNSNSGTCLTDLPDSDGSSSSTCGGSVSVASSMNKEKIYRPEIGSSERKLYFIPTRQSSVVDKSKSKSIDERRDMQLQQLTRASSFTSVHSCTPGLEDDVPHFLISEHETKYDSGEGNLSYLDVKTSDVNIDCISHDDNGIGSSSHTYEPPTLHSSNSDNTINL